ncbi:hypothetical protein QJS10_CPB20g01238 [Acorus calamus]|uniref:Uncharacterized protein n=1 Tax=Acorus calamus TaxID=4465 RepID=A0AAV9C9X5_ACOCL|nr:hypothetical protein QJS10_CPB20g01238 [Acorus calamus]
MEVNSGFSLDEEHVFVEAFGSLSDNQKKGKPVSFIEVENIYVSASFQRHFFVVVGALRRTLRTRASSSPTPPPNLQLKKLKHVNHHMQSHCTRESWGTKESAAVCWGPDEPLKIEEIEVEPPRASEIRPLYPRILGHEGVGLEEINEALVLMKQPDCLKIVIQIGVDREA